MGKMVLKLKLKFLNKMNSRKDIVEVELVSWKFEVMNFLEYMIKE